MKTTWMRWGVAALMLGIGCERAKPGSGTEGDILLGEVGSLSGPEATFGLSTQRGIEFAVKRANAAGGVKGRRLAVRVYDDQSKPEQAANAVTRLIAQDHVSVILGEAASTNSLAMAGKAQEAKVPMITPSSTNPSVTERGDYIFRVCFIDPFQGFVAAKFVRQNLKLGRVAVLTDQKSDYSLGLTDVFSGRFVELGGTIVARQSFSKGDSDFRAQLTAIKQQAPEAIYLPAYYTDVGIIARQAREIGLRAVLIGSDGWESTKLFELGGSAIQGAYFTNHYSSDNPSPRVREFSSEFEKVYRMVPDTLAVLGYDAANVAIEAMKRAADLSGPALRDAIARTTNHPGVAGDITFDAHRNPVKPVIVMQVGEGKLGYVTAISP